jgi:hypothetical protein
LGFQKQHVVDHPGQYVRNLTDSHLAGLSNGLPTLIADLEAVRQCFSSPATRRLRSQPVSYPANSGRSAGQPTHLAKRTLLASATIHFIHPSRPKTHFSCGSVVNGHCGAPNAVLALLAWGRLLQPRGSNLVLASCFTGKGTVRAALARSGPNSSVVKHAVARQRRNSAARQTHSNEREHGLSCPSWVRHLSSHSVST